MTVRVNNFADGVCLAGHREPIRTQEELDRCMTVLREAQLRGVQLIRAAADLNR